MIYDMIIYIGVKFSFEAKRCSFYNGHDFHTSFELERSFSPSKKLNRGSTSYSNHGWAQFENRLNTIEYRYNNTMLNNSIPFCKSFKYIFIK